jgi:DNA-binding CsgD family transcriptional regulator
MHSSPFDHLAEEIEHLATKQEGDRLLQRLVDAYGLRSASYLGINLPTKGTHGDVYVSCTYSEEWLARYDSEKYLKIDPVIKWGFRRVAPFDWNDSVDGDPALRHFFGESQEYGVGKQGLSVPIRGCFGEMALFSISGDLTGEHWSKFKREFMRDFQLIGFRFHEHVLHREHIFGHGIELSERQTEVLRWAAEGKSDWETALIAGLKPRTVRFHIACAMASLGAVNKTQAVAKASRLHLI